jgi:hypothetical protein
VSAREDYPALADIARYQYSDHARALDEIDSLRADVAKLLGMCADVGAEWPVRGDDVLRLEDNRGRHRSAIVDAAVEWFEWHAAHPIDGGPYDVRDDTLWRAVDEYRQLR